MIPMNLTLYTNDLYTMIKSKAKGKDTINLPEFEIKDIFDEDADLIEENYTYNKQLAEEMEKVLEDVEKPSPRTLVLTNRLY